MTWQDELRALDANLAAGNISAEEYRRTRDEVLAKSAMAPAAPSQDPQQSGPQPMGVGTPPPGFPQPGTPPPGFQQPGTPPPGFPQPGVNQPGGQQQGQPGFGAVPPWSMESTQYVQPVTAGPPPGATTGNPGDRTQVVRGGGDAERTQVVSGPGQQGGWRPAPGQQPWPPAPGGAQQGGGDSAPPWGRPDFEPIMPAPESWIRQGPEAFDSGSGGRGKIIGISIAVVLVIGVAVAVVLFFVNKNNGPSQQQAQHQTTQQTTTTKPKPPLPAPPPAKAEPVDTQHALVDPPGDVRNGGGPLDLNTLSSDSLLPKTMVDALTQAGMTDGLLKTTTDNGVTIGLYGFTVRSQDDASTVAHTYAGVQTSGGVPSDEKHSLQGVPVFSTPSGATTSVFRAVYVLYNRVIIVETLGASYPTVEQTFTQVLHDQVALAPPTVRGK